MDPSSQISVRPCSARDLPLLERDLPPAAVHAQHLRYQDEGERTYLGAFLDRRAVGTCVIGWTGCREPEFRQAFPEAIEIAGLQVGEAWRGRGVGTALIEAAERMALEAERHRIVIGVADDNPSAMTLYTHLGYRPTGEHVTIRYELPDADGDSLEMTERTQALVKDLRDPAP